MILLNSVVEIPTGSVLTAVGQALVVLETLDGSGISGILINGDDPWFCDVCLTQNLPEKAFGGPGAAGLIQQKIEGLTARIDGSIEIQPLTANFDIGLIHAP